ncbi:MAG: molybdopterin guanine dinucleotide-containing S/N-oxide reductase [Rhodospirillales bacterium]|jgi:biotin/methionine sulfoxide reductase|nr:molybdopterin guanine dinucleotide-containing S/N-oxide reductase [Rhodospirillales bacterium]MDP6884102.1 molybdopterin guanine dinucleotide-containing S/N-oxide reductase [Rhodospirillales bacterium]
MTTTYHSHSSHWGAFTAEVEDGRLVGVRPFAHDSQSSALIDAMPDAVHDQSRVRAPMVRQGYLRHGADAGGAGRGREPFVEVSWERALDLVSGELARVKEEHGNQAIFGGSYGWSSAGRLHHARTQVRRFLYGFGGCTDQFTNYSYGAAMVFLPHIVGGFQSASGPITSWSSIVDNTRLFVAFGGISLKNGQVNSGGMGDHSYESWLRRAVDAGVRFVNISPLSDDGPDVLNAEWLAIRPTTDTALMLALAHTLVAEGLHDEKFLNRYCTGAERFIPYLLGETDGAPKDAEWAAAITGIGAEAIRHLARQMAAQRTMVTATWSLQRSDHGEQTYWALIALAALLGQIGLPGGGFGFGYGSINGIGNRDTIAPMPSLGTGTNPLGLAIPVARITDMLLAPGSTIEFNGAPMTLPDIRMVYWCGGNPFHHHQDLNRLIEGWRRPETIVVHEPWWTATARHADIVLPATTTLERNDIGSSSRDRFIIAMHKAVEPLGQARNDFDIFSDLADRLGFRAAYTQGLDEMAWLRRLYDEFRAGALSNRFTMPDFDTFWDQGHVEVPEADEDTVLFQNFRRDPEGHKLDTPSGRIEIYSERIAGFGYDDCPPHPTWLEPAEWLGSDKARRHPLHLISNQPKTRLHSQMDMGPVSRAAKINGREVLYIHPQDAAPRGIGAGDVVRVFNDRGACLAGAAVGAGIAPGVVRLPSGAWYDPEDPNRPGSLDKHGNPNVLTLDKGTSRLGQGPSAMTTLVEVEKWDGEAPPITAFTPPAMGEA